MCRIRWLCTLLLLFTAGVAISPANAMNQPKTHGALSLTEAQRARLHRALEPLHKQYDPAAAMIARPFSSPGYHTTLKGGVVHPTRDSLNYAIALLDTGDEELKGRAEAILRKLISLQDQDPQSKTYGIWSWFLEEPLDKMAPPDWNWADFCGVQLLQVALDHRARLPADLMAGVDAAIQHAARSIQKRNVGPGYTNIAIMGTYVTFVAAELYDIADLRDYAHNRLRKFHQYTLHHGGFTEYNSPTYTVVALTELGRLRLHVRDAAAAKLVEDLYRLAWEEIAHHFHAPTRQWGGPHSRTYSTLLNKSVLALIERSTGGRVNFNVADSNPSLDEHRLPLPCPPDLEPFFTTLDQSRTLVKTFFKDKPELLGTTHLAPAFALGSINRGNFWNQQRALLAYWGNAARPSYLHLRFLHDGYDFTAATFYSVQREGNILAGINFATDGGDTHPTLDRIKDATIKAKDLRLRFEFGGAAAESEFSAPADSAAPIALRFDDLSLKLAIPYARFGDTTPRWEVNREKEKAYLNLVLYSGEEKAICLSELDRAAIGIALQMTTHDEPLPAVTTTDAGGLLHLKWRDHSLTLASHADKGAVLREKVSFGR